MNRTITLYPAYFKKQDSSADGEDNFYRILGRNGEAAHKASNNSTVGVIAFDMSPLRGLSSACEIVGYGASYQQRCNIDVWAKQYWITDPLKLTSCSISGQTLNSFNETAFGSQQSTDTKGNDYLDKGVTFFSTQRDGSGLFSGGSAYLGFRLKWHNDQGGSFKTWMKNLSASVTYNPKYIATFYDDDNTVLKTQICDSGVSATPPAVSREGYILHWAINGEEYVRNLPSSTDTDISFKAVYYKRPRPFAVNKPSKGTVDVYVNGEIQSPDSETAFSYTYGAYHGDTLKLVARGCNDTSEDLVFTRYDISQQNVLSTETFDGSSDTEFVVWQGSATDLYVFDVKPQTVYFVVQTSTDGNGSITNTHNVIRHSNDSVTITPNVGYIIERVEVDGVSQDVAPSGMTVQLTDITDDIVVEATFEKIVCNITFDVDSGITVTGPTSVEYGDDATWAFSVDSSHSLTSISVNDGDNVLGTVFVPLTEYELTDGYIAGSMTIHARCTDDLVSVSIGTIENGSATFRTRGGEEITSGKFLRAGELIFTATPDSGYRFASWSFGGTKRSDVLTIDENTANPLVVTATFDHPEYSVIVDIHGNGTVEQSEDYVFADEIVDFKAIPAEGWVFKNWRYTRTYSGGGSSPPMPTTKTDPEITVNAWNEVGTIDAYFKRGKFSVPVSATPGNTVAITNVVIPLDSDSTGEDNVYWYETEFDLTATPGEGFYFLGWSDEPSNRTLERHYKVTHDVSIKANFKKFSFEQNFTVSEGGHVEANGEKVDAIYTDYGDDLTLNIVADFGQKIKDVLINGSSVIEAVTLTKRGGVYVIPSVKEKHEIEVIFEAKTYHSNRLLDYYPPVIASIREIQKLMDVLQVTDDELWDSMSFVMENQFIDSATQEGVTMWERELGIVPAATDTLTQRKARLRLKWVPNNRFTLKWLHSWLEEVCGTTIKTPVVHVKDDYVLTVVLPWFVQWVELFKDLEKYKPANIALDPTVSLPSKDIVLLTGFALKTKTTYTIAGSDDIYEAPIPDDQPDEPEEYGGVIPLPQGNE